jgi:hypothetical protein
LARPVSEYNVIFGGPVWDDISDALAALVERTAAETATGFKKENSPRTWKN